ncbi:MAG: hypothetical protein KBT88_16165 [Gammaproteobacteria bacterium]|nr:hypothetical protein [Gammaproteobacteria bacterium]MBQ0841318.1 hypothetical protein [Gammaproteobacteria bacterium]
MSTPKKSNNAKTITTAVEKSAGSFSLESIRVDQNFGKKAGITKQPKKVKVRKPSKQDFFRTHPDRKTWIHARVIELEATGEVFLIASKIEAQIRDQSRPVILVPVIDRYGLVSIWALKLPPEGCPPMGWHVSSMEAAELAQWNWVKMQAVGKSYLNSVATGIEDDPEWPEPFNLEALIQEAFADRFIDSVNHPVVRRLRGLV